MGLYAKYLFPYLLDWTRGARDCGKDCKCVRAPARGKTLEIGFGTGLNLPFYPETVTELTVLDSESMLRKRVERRLAICPLPVIKMQLDAQGRLPFADRSFDSVVTTLTLCSIANTAPALAEIRRMLKPEGQFIFFEHGRSADPAVARKQDRFNPLQKIIGVGCNMNRPIDQLIRTAGFQIAQLDRFILPKSPRLLAEMYQGIATPSL
jgi:ubiquinone/menaquinone biosynthesis C-methylase UbiE